MCVRPLYLPDGQAIACRHCWACRKKRRDDLAGRCMAESQTATSSHSLTLTYAGDVVGSVVLIYQDVQRAFKRLRSAGFPLRYLVVGEFGERKKRAHWHLVAHWQGPVPDLPPVGRFGGVRWWPHGHVHNRGWSGSSAARYVTKYMLKDLYNERRAARFAMSKKPPLGYEYFIKLADEQVERRALPRDLHYRFPGDMNRAGRPYIYTLQGRMAEMYLDRLAVSWRLRWGEPMPETGLTLEKFYDPIARAEMEAESWSGG